MPAVFLHANLLILISTNIYFVHSQSPLLRARAFRQWLLAGVALSAVILAVPVALTIWALLAEYLQRLRCLGTPTEFWCADQLSTASQGVSGSLGFLLLALALVVVCWAGVFIAFFTSRSAASRPPENFIRGSLKSPADSINATSSEKRDVEPGPHIRFGDLVVPRYIEPLSFLTCGSPGAGKTTAIMAALISINQRSSDKVLLYDRNGDYLKKFYNPARGDVVLGLGDRSTRSWNIWDEFPDGRGIQKFVELAIPREQGTTYWVDNGRIILRELIKVCSTWKQLRQLITMSSPQELVQLLAGTPAQRPLMSKYAEDILSGVNSRTDWMDYLEDPSPLPQSIGTRTTDVFCFHQWAVSDEPSWVFIVAPEQYSAESAPLLTVYFDLVAQAVLTRQVDHTGYSRLWLVMDELTSARYQPRLKDFLAEGRKYGGCAILGFQLISQVYLIYDEHEADTIFGLCQSKLILRTRDGKTCKFLSEMLGTQDYLEPTVSITSNDRGESINRGHQRRNDYLFLPAEIKDLPQYTGIFSMPMFPTAQVQLSTESHRLQDVALPPLRTRPAPAPLQRPNLTVVKPVTASDSRATKKTEDEDAKFNF